MRFMPGDASRQLLACGRSVCPTGDASGLLSFAGRWIADTEGHRAAADGPRDAEPARGGGRAVLQSVYVSKR
jgi:hypothetical protein